MITLKENSEKSIVFDGLCKKNKKIWSLKQVYIVSVLFNI